MPQDLRPYLVLATYDFIVDRNETPYLTVRIDDRCNVPMEHSVMMKNDLGKEVPVITLNISMNAVPNLVIPKDGSDIYFSGSFGGRKMEVVVPMDCVVAVYPKEAHEHAMVFEYVSQEMREAIDNSREVENELTDKEPKRENPLSIVK